MIVHFDNNGYDTEPTAVFWANGCPAGVQDYLDHIDDTYRMVHHATGKVEKHIYPTIIAEAFYDSYGATWAIRGDGVIPDSLDVTDPFATDFEISIGLQQFSTVYRCRINRP